MNEQGKLKKKFNSEKAVFSSGIPEDVCPRLTPMQIKHCKKKSQKKIFQTRLVPSLLLSFSVCIAHVHTSNSPSALNLQTTQTHPSSSRLYSFLLLDTCEPSQCGSQPPTVDACLSPNECTKRKSGLPGKGERVVAVASPSHWIVSCWRRPAPCA